MCVCTCLHCVSPSMSILDQCEIETVVIKRIRCFLMSAVGLCACMCGDIKGRHRANSLHGELDIWQCNHLCKHVCTCLNAHPSQCIWYFALCFHMDRLSFSSSPVVRQPKCSEFLPPDRGPPGNIR